MVHRTKSKVYSTAVCRFLTHSLQAEGVLVTGCQSTETSADACPSGNPKKAFGALSNALTTTVAQIKKKNPNAKITNYFIVQQVRWRTQ